MFTFKLQQVLDYRKNIEDKTLDEFSKIKRELAMAEWVLNNLIQERLDLTGELKKIQGRPVPVEDICFPVSYIEQIRGREEKQEQAIAEIKDKLEAKRAELLEAVKKRKVMEKLKEHHREEYERFIKDWEQKNSDEMAVLRFERREK